MLNRRGGEPDVVKVLDFGLVKAIDDEKQARQTGRPGRHAAVYVARSDPDARSGRCPQRSVCRRRRRLFPADGPAGVQRHVAGRIVPAARHGVPDAPSQRLGQPVSAELESACWPAWKRAGPNGRRRRAIWRPCSTGRARLGAGRSTMPRPGGGGMNGARQPRRAPFPAPAPALSTAGGAEPWSALRRLPPVRRLPRKPRQPPPQVLTGRLWPAQGISWRLDGLRTIELCQRKGEERWDTHPAPSSRALEAARPRHTALTQTGAAKVPPSERFFAALFSPTRREE